MTRLRRVPTRPRRSGALSLACALGAGALLAACGNDPTGSNRPPGSVSLSVGGSQLYESGQGSTITVPASAAGTYALTVFNAATEARTSVAVNVTGTGLAGATVAASGAADAATAAGGGAQLSAEAGAAGALPITDAPVMARFRRLAQRELVPRVPYALSARTPAQRRAGGPRLSTAAAVPAVGDLLTFNTRTDSACAASNAQTARVVAVGQRAVVAADVSNPAGGFTDAEYASVAAAFDTLIYPVNVRNFGAPTDLDGNGRVIILYTRAVNELTPANVEYIVGGFFWNRDIFPRTATNPRNACPGSNDGELFYQLVPDPAGTVNGNARSKDYVFNSTLGVVGHEFQHLISATRRLYVQQTANFDEEVWLNEGLSHIAEEALFYQSARLSPTGQIGQSPRSDLTIADLRASQAALNAINTFGVSNLGRLSQYLRAPADSSPFSENDELATRGAAWSLVRYALDRTGVPDSATLQRLVNSNQLGVANLRAATGAGAALDDWVRDWAVANYVDGLASGLDANLTYKSWNFRSILSALRSNNSTYPLQATTLVNGTTQAKTIVGGGAAYYTFTVAGGDATIRVQGANGAALPANARVALVRVR